MEAWEHEQFNSYYESSSGRGWQRYHNVSSHRTRYETVEDSERLASRKGDIIKFGSGYYERGFGDWRDWFLNREQKKLFWQRIENIPKYAIYQFAVVANRYKWIKYKCVTWQDYGVILMFVTGNKPCRIRKYYVGRPYERVSYFPHIRKDGSIYVKMKKPFRVIDKTWFLFDFNLSEFIINLLKNYGDTEECRDMFLKKIKQLLENNI